MAKRSYGQFCGLTRAVDIVGERWALLIIRDLLVCPKRFTDLRRGLPRIPSNILSTRLRELEDAGVVQRRILPRPEGSVVYELTEYGRDLEDIVLALGRWGARALGEPAPNDIVTIDSVIMATRTVFNPDAASGLCFTYELHLGAVVIHASIDDGKLDVAEGPLPGADLVIHSSPEIRALLTGEITPAEAIADGVVEISGDPALLSHFVEVFHV